MLTIEARALVLVALNWLTKSSRVVELLRTMLTVSWFAPSPVFMVTVRFAAAAELLMEELIAVPAEL